MRPLLAVLLAVLILATLSVFFRLQDSPRVTTAAPDAQPAKGRFDIEITLTFEAGPDPFALAATDAPAVVIEFRGDEILRLTRPTAAGTPIVVENVEGITVGENSFYVRCTPKAPDADASLAVRVRILCDGREVADETLWSAAGSVAEGLVKLRVADPPDSQRDDADPAADKRAVSSAAAPRKIAT